MFRTSTSAFLATAILTCVASDASAQMVFYKTQPLVKSASKTYAYYMGTAILGSHVFTGTGLSARRYGRTAAANNNFMLSTNVRFLNTNNRIAYFRASIHSDNYSSKRNYATAIGYLGNNRVFSKTYYGTSSHSSQGIYATADLFPQDRQLSFSLAWVPITVRGNVGIGLGAAAAPLMSNGRAVLGGHASAWATGRASATAGVKGYSARVELAADFAKPRISASATVDAVNWRFAANTRFSMRSVTMKLKVYLRRNWQYFQKTLTAWSYTGKTITLLRF